jgi:hypothetical protein
MIGQMIKEQYGSAKYIDLYSGYAKKIGIDDLRFSQDSIKIRIWKAGKLIDLSIRKDTIIGQRIFYVHTNASKKRDPSHHRIIYYMYNIENKRLMAIKPMIDTICQHFPGEKDKSSDLFFRNNSGKINYDSISFYKLEEKMGGSSDAIEYADREYYVWTGWIPKSTLGEILEKMMDDLEMNNFDKLDISKLPKGAWYSYGGTTAVYKMTFFQSLIDKISFWKRI